MGDIINVFRYLWLFIINQEFREGLPWMKWLAKKFSAIHQHIWTCSRFPAGIIVIIAMYYDAWLAFALFVIFSLTDMIDGMVARYKKQQSGRFGALLDATADKCFVLPVMAKWINDMSPSPVLYVEIGIMILIEASNGLLLLMEKRGYVESSILYEHLWYGKAKFVAQIVFIGIMWISTFHRFWPWWEVVLGTLMGGIILLAFLSVAGKINRFRQLTSI